jgi:hypothetical protein
VKVLRFAPAFAVALVLFLPHQGSAQNAAPRLPGCSWNCYSVVLPYGLYVREVVDDGSYVILEDGSVWEVRLPQRPNASSWRPGDFVQLKSISAPVEDYEILLAHTANDKAEVRLVGRDHAPPSNFPQE